MTETENKQIIENKKQEMPATAMVLHDNSQFATILDTGKFQQLWRFATAMSKTQFIPETYQGHVEDCFIACHMALRLECDPVFFMQKSYVVHGKPGIEAQLCISLVNTSGLFADPLDYEIEGVDPSKPDYRVRATAVRKSTGKTLLGPWIDWRLVKAEGWYDKKGSKWQTMPAQMFIYRAATYFARAYCPERLMGMYTIEELHEEERKPVESTVQAPTDGRVKMTMPKRGKAAPTEPAKEAPVTATEGPVEPSDVQTPADAPPEDDLQPDDAQDPVAAQEQDAGEAVYTCRRCLHDNPESKYVKRATGKMQCPDCHAIMTPELKK